jgi:hypothetical protein
MGRMSDLDIVRQEHGLPVDTPLETLVQLAESDATGEPLEVQGFEYDQFPLPVVALDGEIERGDWAEATYHDRMEDLEI